MDVGREFLGIVRVLRFCGLFVDIMMMLLFLMMCLVMLVSE